nr:Coenzyme F420 hydrogenase/dehydrogenase, beta subunit C-terminal domain [Holtiella tumoricola]
MCEKVCPELKQYANPNALEPQALGAWNLDAEIRKQSSSGGVFTALAEWIIDQNGVIFGAGFDEGFRVTHRKIIIKKALAELRSSKYVQSNIGDTYAQAKECLGQGKKVLFTGTPCQIAGLYTYLQKKYENLYTCDVACHGVPSPKVFEKYKDYLEDKHSGKITKMTFRDKVKGWKSYWVTIKFENDKLNTTQYGQNPYMIGFLKDIYLRPSCYECTFSTIPRVADITLADFWGVGAKYPELDDDKGTSLLLINTQKGKELLLSCKEQIFIQECNLKYAIKHNPCIAGAVKPHPEREQFFKDLDNISFDKLIKKYLNPPNVLKRVKGKVWGILSRIKRRIFR